MSSKDVPSSTKNWHKLAFERGPELLFRFNSTPGNGYELLITDLTYVWSESLSRHQILKRAEKYDTSIDPSEDQEQFDILISTVRDALSSATEDSSVQVAAATGNRKSPGADDDDQMTALEIETTTKLPPPLRTLTWVFELERQPLNAITEHIVIPLLALEKDREERIASLFRILHDKDWALERILDRMEGVGVDVTAVFPGHRFPRHGSMLEKVSPTVRGIAPFVIETWSKQFERDSDTAGYCSNITKELFGNNSQQILRPSPDFWWLESRPLKKSQKPTSRKQTTKTIAENDEDSDTDTDFESRPPAVKSKTQRKDKGPGGDYNQSNTETESTDSSGDHKKRQARRGDKPQKRRAKLSSDSSGPSSSESEEIPRSRGHRLQTKKLGTVGGVRKKQQPHRSSDSDSGGYSSEGRVHRATEQDNIETKKSKRRGLGTIGGKHEETRKPSEQSTSVTERGDTEDSDTEKGSTPDYSFDTKPHSKQTSRARVTGKKGLGTIGGKGKKPRPSSETKSDSETPTEDALTTKGQRQRQRQRAPVREPPKEAAKPKLGTISSKAKAKRPSPPSTDESTDQGVHEFSDADTRKSTERAPRKRTVKSKIGVIGGKSPHKRRQAPTIEDRRPLESSLSSARSTDEENRSHDDDYGRSKKRPVSPLPSDSPEQPAGDNIATRKQESDQPGISAENSAARKKPLPPVQVSAAARKKRRF